MIEVKFEGVEKLSKRLESIESDLKKKGGRFALRKAANLVRDDAKRRAREVNNTASKESIADNIAVRWSTRRFKRTGDLMFRVGVLGGARQGSGNDGNPGGDTFHWRFVEFGSEHNNPARPFMRPALSENIDKVIAEFVRQYDRALDRALRKAT